MTPEKLEGLLSEADRSAAAPIVLSPEAMLRRIQASRPKQSWHRFVPLSAAAMLLLAAGLVWILGTASRPAAAAELLDAINATQAYKGWMHLTIEMEDSTGVKRMAVMHVDTANGILAEVQSEGSGVMIESAATRQGSRYDSATKTITFFDIDSDQIRRIATACAEMVTLNGMTDHLKEQQSGDDSVRVDKAVDGALECFTISILDAHRNELNHAIIWVDPGSGLISKLQSSPLSAAKTRERISISYGKPEVRDIYDLGAPRTAAIEDRRPNERIKQVLDRIDANIAKGAGDGLLVMTVEGDKNTRMRDKGLFNIYATQGKAFFEFNYTVTTGNLTANDTPAPQGWPHPATVDVLDFIGKTPLQSFFIGDSQGHYYAGSYSPTSHQFRANWPGRPNQVDYPAREASHEAPKHNAAYQMWIGRGILDMYDDRGDLKIESIPNDKQPNLVGFRVHDTGPASSATTYELIVDPDRNSIPISFMDKSPSEDKPDITEITRRTYSQYAQLSDGRWYPSKWELSLDTMTAGTDTPVRSNRSAYQLYFDATAKIPEEWFADPTKRTAPETGLP